MATVTDLTGSEVAQRDETSVQVGEDSNVNVYEFGNILLAGILPTVSSWVKSITDKIGSQLSGTDKYGTEVAESDMAISNSEAYDFGEYTYEQNNMTYNGIIVQGSVVDTEGS